MFYSQLSEQNLEHWFRQNGYSPMQTRWLIKYSNHIDITLIMDNTFPIAKMKLIGYSIKNRLSDEQIRHLRELKVDENDWLEMVTIVSFFDETYHINEEHGNIVVYHCNNKIGQYSKQTWGILSELNAKNRN